MALLLENRPEFFFHYLSLNGPDGPLEGDGMTCPRCQQENPAEAHFCMKCGAGLTLACAKCNTELPTGAGFCFACGQPVTAAPGGQRFTSPEAYTPKHLAEKILTSKAALEGERKQVTVLFADLKGSMELLADRDPKEARKLLDPVLERMMEAVHRYEGTVNQVMGDGIMALFGAPLAHEDHAVRACYAALRMQESVAQYAEGVFRSHGVPLQIRVGLNSGEVVVRAIGSDLHMDYTAVGQTTHLAARMEQMATPGTILLAPATLQLAEGYVQVAARGPVVVKGLPDPVEIYALTGASASRTRLHAAAARGFTRFVGRDAEIEQLRRTLALAHDGHGQLVAIVGEPGPGLGRRALLSGIGPAMLRRPDQRRYAVGQSRTFQLRAGGMVLKLRELKHGPASAWPPLFGGAYGRGDKFPVGEVGVLKAVELARGMSGLHIEIEYEGRTWSGVMQWDGGEPPAERVVEVLSRYLGRNLRELRDIELD